MSNAIDTNLAQACARITHARELAEKRYKSYYNACIDFNWALAEQIRGEILANVESFMDEIAAVHKFIEVQRGTNKKR